MMTLRPIDTQTDLPRMVELMNTVSAEPVTVERLQEWEGLSPAGGIRQRIAAVDESDRIVGFNDSGHWPFMLAHRFWIDVIVDQALRRQGIGTRLYDNALQFSQAQQATRLEAEARDHNPDWLRFAEQRGFKIERHIFESTLDLATFDESRFAGVVASVEATGIRFFTLADIENSAELRRKHYELSKRNSLDIPGSDGTFPPFEDFQKFVYESKWYRPEGQIIAADGERWVGMTALGHNEQTNSLYTHHTGVAREYRGRNIAPALKLLSIRYARKCGAIYMRTNNDSKNEPILAINRKLGYVPQPGYYKLIKELRDLERNNYPNAPAGFAIQRRITNPPRATVDNLIFPIP